MGIVWRWLGRLVVLAAGLAVVAVGIIAFAPQTARTLFEKAGASTVASLLPSPLPAATEIREAHWLDQSWSERDRYWFHYTSQGTATFPVPYDWFVEFERPELSPFGAPGRLADTGYLQRFGFIPGTSAPRVTSESAAPRRDDYAGLPEKSG